MLHHLIIMPFFAWGLYSQVCSMYHFLFLLEELSTPLGNMRWFLIPKKGDIENAANTRKLNRVSLLFAATFIAVRMGYGMLVWYSFIGNYNFLAENGQFSSKFDVYNARIQFFVCTLTRFLNAYWTYLIFCSATKKNKNKNQ